MLYLFHVTVYIYAFQMLITPPGKDAIPMHLALPTTYFSWHERLRQPVLILDYSLCEVWSLVIYSQHTAASAFRRSHAYVSGYTHLEWRELGSL